MSEIIVNVGMLNQSIMQLTKLATICNNKKRAVSMQGGGATILEIEDMVKLYNGIYDELARLIVDTGTFMKNIKDSYEFNDQNIARQISSGI